MEEKLRFVLLNSCPSSASCWQREGSFVTVCFWFPHRVSVPTGPCPVDTQRYKKKPHKNTLLNTKPSNCQPWLNRAQNLISRELYKKKSYREGQYHLLSRKKKDSHSQGYQPDLNLRPKSRRLPLQIQSCLAPDWRHCKLVSVGAIEYPNCCEYPAYGTSPANSKTVFCPSSLVLGSKPAAVSP